MPATAHADRGAVRLVLVARGVRALGDGLVSVLLPAHLLALGHDAFTVGAISTATLLGSAALTLTVGLWAHRVPQRRILVAGAVLLVATGAAFAAIDTLWLLFAVALVGTINPSAGDASFFVPVEHSRIADATAPAGRTSVFARYSLVASLAAALGTVAAGWLDRAGIDTRWGFLAYAALGFVLVGLYLALPVPAAPAQAAEAAAASAGLPPLATARRPVLILAALFSLDSFGGGFVLQSMLAVWLFDRFDLALAQAADILAASSLLAAFSQLAAPWVARRIGLVNTMVWTHLPANLFLMLAPFAPTLEIALGLLLLRAALSSMDVAPRSALVMAIVPPGERAAAAGVTAVPRSLAAAFAPAIAGAMLAASPFGWSLVVGAGLKAVYDVLLLVVGRRLARERGVKDFK